MISSIHPLLLGSGSPRRRELLEQLSLPLVVRSSAVDESVLGGERATVYLERIVDAKLMAVQALDLPPHAAVLVADTAVVMREKIFGKPTSAQEAAEMLGQLLGNVHEVMTRVAIASETERAAFTVRTQVCMRAADAAEIRGYVRTGEGLDKAGAYAIQGLGAQFVERIEGSYTNVVGLPLCEVVVALRQMRLLATS